jgi:peptide/nickel transport system ATP-binding protein
MPMESGRTEEVLARPAHPYTRALLDARPQAGVRRGEKLRAIKGSAPSSGDLPPGCPFAGRCPLTIPACSDAPPAPVFVTKDHFARCIRIDAAEHAL